MKTAMQPRSNGWGVLYDLEIATVMLLVAFLPAVGVVVAVFGAHALLPGASVCGGIVLFVQRQAMDWKCPHCGEPFLRRRGKGFALLFRACCGSCGIRRGANLC